MMVAPPRFRSRGGNRDKESREGDESLGFFLLSDLQHRLGEPAVSRVGHPGPDDLADFIDQGLSRLWGGVRLRVPVDHPRRGRHVLVQQTAQGVQDGEHDLFRLGSPHGTGRGEFLDDQGVEVFEVWDDEGAHDLGAPNGVETPDSAVVGAGRFTGVEEVLEAGAREAGFEVVGAWGVFGADVVEEGGGEVSEVEVVERADAGA